MRFLIFALLAATPDEVNEARKHYEAGRALYSVDRFADAAVEFQAGYALAPKPLFLFNAAQSLRRQAELTHDRTTMLKAQERYLEYLRIAPQQDPEREQSTAKLSGIAQWLKENRAVEESPPPAVTPVERGPEPVAASPAAAPVRAVVEPPRPAEVEQRGFFAQHPWVLIVAGGVVVAGAASVGTYFGVRQAQGGCATATVGCLDARH